MSEETKAKISASRKRYYQRKREAAALTRGQGEKRCPRCGLDKATDCFHKNKSTLDGFCRWCKDCRSGTGKDAYKGRPHSHKRSRNLRRRGLTLLEYQHLVEIQDGVCAICSNPPSPGKPLAVDHNHQTGEIRGLLCDACNIGLGMLKDSPTLLSVAIDYLTRDRSPHHAPAP